MVAIQKALNYLLHEKSDTGLGIIGPFLLNCVVTNLLRLPRTDIANFAIGIVVPTLPRDRVGNCFAQLVRTGVSQGIQYRQIAGAAGAIRIRLYRVEDLPIDIVMVAAKRLARTTSALVHSNSRWEVNEIKRVGARLRESGVIGNLVLEHVLYVRIGYRLAWIGRSYRGSADAAAVSNSLRLRTIFGQLIDERAGQDIIEESVDLLDEIALRCLRPCLSPEDCEDLSVADQRAAAIGELWCRSNFCYFSPIKRYNLDRITSICIDSHVFSFYT